MDRPLGYRTKRFQALGYDFCMVCEDDALGRYFDRIYGHLAVPGTPSHEYAVYTDPERENVLDYDGSIMIAGPSPSVILEHLLWHVNYEVTRTTTDRVLLHSSAAEHNGKGLLFPAPMESGKTTLVAGLAMAGLAYVTDEAAALDLDTLALHPYPKPLSVDPGSWDVLRDLEPDVDPAVRKYLTTQWHVPPGDLGPGRIAAPSQPAYVITPRYDANGPTELVPMSRAEGLFLLANNCFNLQQLGRRGFDVLVGVVRQSTCYRLHVSDLDRAVELVFGLLGAEPERRSARAASA